MHLAENIENYLTIKRSLGAVFSSDARILHSFAHAMGDVPLDSLTRDACQAFCRGTGEATRFWERKYYTLRGFFNYAIARGRLGKSPLPDVAPRIPRLFEGYVYSHDELRRLLDGTAVVEHTRSRVQPLTLRMIILTLYGAGLRPSEGLRLRCCDVDVVDRVLAIWDTKFFKSRLVPIGTELTGALKAYWTFRQELPLPKQSESRFFAMRGGKPISLNVLEKLFVRVREHAHVQRQAEDRWQPRLHDLRGTFAVRRVIAWYHEGVDLNAHLPLLATYLGHRNLSGTQSYLRMIPELLTLASQRFERYAGRAQGSHYA